MPTVVYLNRVREQRADSYRAKLLAVARQPAVPLEQALHARTGKPCLVDDAAHRLADMFALFGVDLDPQHEDFDLVNHTWFELGCAAVALESRERFGETTYRRRAVAWSPAYVAWLDALWAGNPVAVRAAAAALGVAGGIADTGESLRYRTGHLA